MSVTRREAIYFEPTSLVRPFLAVNCFYLFIMIIEQLLKNDDIGGSFWRIFGGQILAG